MILFFEGVDGAGKTTLVKNFHDYLVSQNVKSEIVKFPRDDKIRDICKGYENSTAKTLLYFSDMKNWWDLPKDFDTIYLVDRFYTTTEIYQVHLQKENKCKEYLFTMLKRGLFRGGMLHINTTIWVKADFNTIKERLDKRRSIHDDEDDDTLLKIIDLYESIYRRDKDWVVVNGNSSQESMLKELKGALKI